MLKPIRWNTFLRDFIVIQIGFLLYGVRFRQVLPQMKEEC